MWMKQPTAPPQPSAAPGPAPATMPTKRPAHDAVWIKSPSFCGRMIAALAIMRPQKDGLLIHTASWAGRFVGIVAGAGPGAAEGWGGAVGCFIHIGGV